MLRCYFCGTELEVSGVVSRGEICPQCRRDVRCCCNCAFHDPRASNQCREPRSEAMRDRESGNFCDFFRCADRETQTRDQAAEQKAREEWERLFRK